MMTIENLKKEVDEIKNSLYELKNNVSLSEIEKKSKAESLKIKVETTKQKIEEEIHSLENKTDDESKKKKEEAETLLMSFTDIMNLYNSILNPSSTPTKTPTQPETEDKNVFVKAKDWVKEQRDATTLDNLKKEPGKTMLRGIGFALTGIGAFALTVKGVRSLWNRAFGKDKAEKKEESEKDESEKTDKKSTGENQSFWKTGWGNFLKWAGITTAIGGGVYGVSKLTGNKETIQEGGVEVSEAMFKQLLYMEGNQDFIAKSHGKKFGEDFVTGPYGMVYKHIDENGNLLKNPVPFKNGEHVSKDWAEKNARAYYNKRAKERSDLLKGKGYKYSQDMLDALVSASGGTKKSTDNLKNFVLSHWDDKDAIFDYMSKFATTAAGNGKTMPGLVIRRNFEANRFKGNTKPFSDYQKRYYA